MADSFFGFDTSSSNINDDDGGGGDGSEDEYDALNDETFGHAEEFDWDVEHENLALQIGNRQMQYSIEESHSQLEASLSQLVLDETDHPNSLLTSSVWRHDPPPFRVQPTPVPAMKNVCTVEELERQIRQKQQSGMPPQINYYQPRFPSAIMQRPPGLSAPVGLPFPPQQMGPNMSQTLNNIMGQGNQMGNQLGNHMGNQLGQVNQLPQMGQMNINKPIGQPIGQPGNQLGQMIGGNQNLNQFMQNSNAFPNTNNMNQMQPNMGNQMQPNMGNQMQPNMGNQMMNGNQFGPNMGQFPPMMGQHRMMAPPPGLNMPRQNFSPNLGQFNPNFRPPAKPMDQQQQPMNNQPNQMNQQLLQSKQSPITNSQSKPMVANQGQQKTILQNQNQTKNNNNNKQRQFNNTANKNMTSENLVQFIQNTHPILQINSGYHNANHHPMLNRGLMNVLNQNFFNNQRPNGVFNNTQNNNGHSQLTEDEILNCMKQDDYAGLMTQREKQWLINIQMLQLNTGTPYMDDFYYTVFLERKSRKEKEGVKEAHKANQQNHPFYSGVNKQENHQHRERNNSARLNSNEDVQYKTYVPTQFENSLGKLQCGSVTAPRKIIDVELVSAEADRGSRAPSVASTTNPSEVPREVRKTKQLLIDIESLYLVLLRLEDLSEPLAIANALILKEREEKQKLLEIAQKEMEAEKDDDSTNLFLRNIESVQRKPKVDSPKADIIDKRQVVNLTMNSAPAPSKNLLDENKDELVNKMFAGLLHEDRVQQFMMVRKGRVLISRFVSVVPVTHSRLRVLWSRVQRALSAAGRRGDAELHGLAGHLDRYIQASNGWSAILESCNILTEALDPARTHYVLTTTLTLSCVASLIEKASTLVNTTEATSNERHYTKFLKTFARSLKNTNLTVARPVKSLSETKLRQHVKRLESRSTIEILQRGKTAAEFADLSKQDLSDLLTKYLC